MTRHSKIARLFFPCQLALVLAVIVTGCAGSPTPQETPSATLPPTVASTPTTSPAPTPTAVESDSRYFELMMQSENFKVYFHSQDSEFAGNLIRVGEEVFPLLLKTYGDMPPDWTAVFVYSDWEEATRLGSFPPFVSPSSTTGEFDTFEPLGDGVKLYIPSKEKVWSLMTERFMKNLMAHEVGHRFFYHAYPNIRKPVRPDWLDEGLAGYVGIEASQMWKTGFCFDTLVQAVKASEPPLAGLDALDKLHESGETQALFGDEALSVICYIYVTYGEKALREILIEYNQSISLSQAFERVLGVPYTEFQKSWLNRIRELAAQANNGAQFYSLLMES